MLGCATRLASIDPNAADNKGQDTWNYLAAGERLNAGHSIYAIVPGDRPTIIWPPGFAPLGSPPLVAVVWRPLALLPDTIVMWRWWAVSAALMLATSLWICLKGKLRAAGASRIKARILVDNVAVERLYPPLGFRRGETFRLHGRNWVLMVLDDAN